MSLVEILSVPTDNEQIDTRNASTFGSHPLQVGKYTVYFPPEFKGDTGSTETYNKSTKILFKYEQPPSNVTIANYKLLVYFTGNSVSNSFVGWRSTLVTNQYNAFNLQELDMTFTFPNIDGQSYLNIRNNSNVLIASIDNGSYPVKLQYSVYDSLQLNPIVVDEREVILSWKNSGGLAQGDYHRIYYAEGNLTAEQLVSNGTYVQTESYTDTFWILRTPTAAIYSFVIVDVKSGALGTRSNVQTATTIQSSQIQGVMKLSKSDGTLLSQTGDFTNPVYFKLAATINESKEQKLYIECEDGYTIANLTLTAHGNTKSNWVFAPDNNGVAGSYVTEMSIGTVGGVAGQLVYFWVKASASSTELAGSDTSVRLVASGIVSTF